MPGLDSFFEQDEPGVSARGIILLLVLLAALGAGGWWAYTHYNGARPAPATTPQTANQTPATQPSATESAADNSAPKPKSSEPLASAGATTSPSPLPSTNSSEPAGVPPTASANSTPAPVVEPKSELNPPASTKATERVHPPRPNQASHGQKIARAEVKPTPRPAVAVPASGDKGDAEFKKGEAYLYGRGVPENCNEAIKNLKVASAKQNAKARSAFGTMYATGHCVARDLPTSYSWFAQALRADPNNQILEKDLTAVWNQMTPPERQMAAKNK